MLDWLFCNKDKPIEISEEIPNIEIGEKWILKSDDGSPWPMVSCKFVTIKDIKDGWVRYHINTYFPDERKKMNAFCRMYMKLESSKEA